MLNTGIRGGVLTLFIPHNLHHHELEANKFWQEKRRHQKHNFFLLPRLWKRVILSPLKTINGTEGVLFSCPALERDIQHLKHPGEMQPASTATTTATAERKPPLVPGTPLQLQPRALPFVFLFWGGPGDAMPLLVKPLPLLYNPFTIMVVFIAKSSVNFDSVYNLSKYFYL